jgi:hypothetical protein
MDTYAIRTGRKETEHRGTLAGAIEHAGELNKVARVYIGTLHVCTVKGEKVDWKIG